MNSTAVGRFNFRTKVGTGFQQQSTRALKQPLPGTRPRFGHNAENYWLQQIMQHVAETQNHLDQLKMRIAQTRKALDKAEEHRKRAEGINQDLSKFDSRIFHTTLTLNQRLKDQQVYPNVRETLLKIMLSRQPQDLSAQTVQTLLLSEEPLLFEHGEKALKDLLKKSDGPEQWNTVVSLLLDSEQQPKGLLTGVTLLSQADGKTQQKFLARLTQNSASSLRNAAYPEQYDITKAIAGMITKLPNDDEKANAFGHFIRNVKAFPFFGLILPQVAQPAIEASLEDKTVVSRLLNELYA